MAYKEWWVSVNAGSYAEALKEAEGNGDTLIELSGAALFWGSDRYLLDPEKQFAMVDWSALEEFVREDDSGASRLWFAHVRDSDRLAAGLKPNERLYLDIVDRVPRVGKATDTQLMRYLVTVL